ncbi:MAG: hypothetical protein DWB56_14800 [Candidatus Jettenia sp.]|uniref:Uncharacterized protein n=1 Tax=Candidatus Jettenia caeni TaxID=247490 RepID=I3ILS6_9BACT|nr:hypothetical protein [Candidatus Jettenia sp.]GAB62671.1 hypothetical protein KSU1_C1075 [Candidatus Jettenia caeni]
MALMQNNVNVGAGFKPAPAGHISFTQKKEEAKPMQLIIGIVAGMFITALILAFFSIARGHFDE